MNKKTLILTIDLAGAPDWQRKAMQMQLSDWLQKNKTLLPIEDLVIMPANGETRLFWLEGNADDLKDVKTLEDIKDRIKPIMEIALGIKVDRKKLYKDPNRKRL
jgi:hypothetical protein